MMRSFEKSLKRLVSRAEGRVLPTFFVGLIVAVLLQSSVATAMISATFMARGAISAAAALMASAISAHLSTDYRRRPVQTLSG
jgi:phosphate:Na+ symporter